MLYRLRQLHNQLFHFSLDEHIRVPKSTGLSPSCGGVTVFSGMLVLSGVQIVEV